MVKMKISVIIPIFNVEDYISRCLDSIYNQGVDEALFEVIAVNDGSTDNSGSVIKGYQEIHQNLHLIEQENKGVSSARNKAISVSKGDYLIFVDPDDAIIDNALYSLVEFVAGEMTAPVIIMRSFGNGMSERYKWGHLFATGAAVNCIEAINKGFVRGSVCGCAFGRSFVIDNSLAFPIGVRNSEDTIFFFRCMAFCDKLLFVDIPFYQVIGRKNSASKSYSRERISNYVKSIEMVNDYIDSENNLLRKDLYYLLKYLLLLNLIKSALHTPDVSLSYLRSTGVEKLAYVKCKYIKYNRLQMFLIRNSIPLSYYLLKISGR